MDLIKHLIKLLSPTCSTCPRAQGALVSYVPSSLTCIMYPTCPRALSVPLLVLSAYMPYVTYMFYVFNLLYVSLQSCSFWIKIMSDFWPAQRKENKNKAGEKSIYFQTKIITDHFCLLCIFEIRYFFSDCHDTSNWFL